jgi:lipopolysaccharide transport system ATP-binding protein
MQTVIKVEDLSKQYRLGKIGTGTLSHDLNRWWHSIRGKDNPYLKLGEVNDRATIGLSDYVWALKDINFSVNQGEVLGIIGKNGAGKSTLLKLLSRVTSPTTGNIKIKGRIASLLEVGTGFNPEMTGRENVFLNGTIMGMSKTEIKSKFDEIVEFSGTARYIDTPVKRYSSGMKVRLAFAVAAHLEPEILIVDEVLAVGDAEFQKKAIGKMQDVAKGGGRTVLFVSHNMGSLKALCSRGLLLQNGLYRMEGNIDDCINTYLAEQVDDTISYSKVFKDYPNLPLQINSVKLVCTSSNSNIIDFRERLVFELEILVREKVANRGIIIRCHDQFEELFSTFDVSQNMNLLENRDPGNYKLKVTFPEMLRAGTFSFDFQVGCFGVKIEQSEKRAIVIESEVMSRNPSFQGASRKWGGKLYIEPKWEYSLLT